MPYWMVIHRYTPTAVFTIPGTTAKIVFLNPVIFKAALYKKQVIVETIETPMKIEATSLCITKKAKYVQQICAMRTIASKCGNLKILGIIA